MRCYAEAGIRVRLFLTTYRSYEQEEEAAIRRAWSLPESVEFRYFWRDAAPGGGGAPPEPGAIAGIEHRRRAGSLLSIERADAAGELVARDYFDPHGLLVQRDRIDPATGKPAVRRWFTASGACWLTAWLDDNRKPRNAVRHLPEPVAYDDFGQCVAEWIDAEIADSPVPVVFSDRREYDVTLFTLRHSSARRVAIVHNGHIRKPYGDGDSTKANYRPLLENLAQVDVLVVASSRQREHIAARYGTEPTVINHAAPIAPELTANREERVLAVVARLSPEKRLEDAIRAFARAVTRVPGARFDIYGTGPKAGALEQLVNECGLGERVRFRGYTKYPLTAFATASATVLTSKFEGWGMAIAEAMAVGTPAIAYAINYGPGEIIRDEVDGLLVPPRDIDALADAMVRVLGDPDYAAQLGERAREVSERFSRERWRAEWLELYTAVRENPQRRTEPPRPRTPATLPGPSSERLSRRISTAPPVPRSLSEMARASRSLVQRGVSVLSRRARAPSGTSGGRLTRGPVPGDDGTWHEGYYRDGLPVLLHRDEDHAVGSGHGRGA
jgi:poly(glycerol-phosphate) alpha-glucosyltransferase